MDKTGAIVGWNNFAQALNARFGPSGYDDPTCLLAKLRQSSTVQECQNQFENLANRIEGLNEQFMISRFIASLKEEIWLGVQMF